MKHFSKSLLLLIVLFTFSSLMYQSANENIIQAGGYIKHENKKVSGVSIKIYDGKNLYSEQISDRIGRYSFILRFNKTYRIELAKEGYLRSVITINTDAPKDVVQSSEEIPWQTDFKLFKQMPGMRMDQFKKATAHYKYDNWFIIEDEGYKTEIADDITALKAIISEKKQQAFAHETKMADSLITAKNYEEAILALNKAIDLNPELKQLKKKQKSTTKLLKKSQSLDEGYSNAITKADELFQKDKLDEAIPFYQKAVIYKPKEVYPTDQLYQIDSIKSYRWIEKNNQYEEFILKADSLYQLEMFDSSLYYFSNASNIFEDKEYAKEMTLVLDSIVGEHSTDTIVVSDTVAQQEPITADTIIEKNVPVVDSLNQKPEPELVIQDTTLKAELDTVSKVVEDTVMQTTDTIRANLDPKKELADTIQQQEEIIPESKEEIKKDTLPVETEEQNNIAETQADTSRNVAFSSIETNESLQKLQNQLEEANKKDDKATSSMVLEEIGMIYQTDFKLAKALQSYEKSLELKRAIGDRNGEAEQMTNIASVMYDSGSYNEAIETFEESLLVTKEIGNKEQESEILINMATVYENTYRYQDAITLLQESVNIKEELGDKEVSGDIRRSIGNIYYEQNNYAKAIEEFEKTIQIEQEQADADDLSTTYNNLGAAYYQMNDMKKAIDYYQKSLEITEKTNNKKEQSITLNNLGNINFSLSDFTKAIAYYEQSLKIKEDISFFAGMASTLHNMGNAYFYRKEYDKAIEYYQASFELAEKQNYQDVIWRNYEAFSKSYSAKGDYKKAYQYYQKYTQGKYEVSEIDQQIVEMRQQYESSKIAVKKLKKELQKQNRIARYEAEQNRKEMQIVKLEIDNKQQKLEKQRNVIIFFIFGTLLILTFSLVVTRQYQQKNKAYKVIADQQRHIMDGISYASRIQHAVLPTTDLIDEILPNKFLINKPKEVVSGDFYWAAKHFGKSIIAVADCTGHGVPGGFMSMLGVAILNETISVETPLKPNDILERLRQRVMTALHQESKESETRDGMDITLIMIDPSTNTLQFSGAYHSLYHVRNCQLDVIKGDRMPIGFHRRKKDFTTHTVQLEKGDMLYMTSDGYIDQLGEANWERFMAGRFKTTLLEICKLSLEEQQAKLEKINLEWRGNVEQTDDIMLLGIRI